MKSTTMKFALLPCALLTLALNANANIIVPGANGSDGVLNITENTVIDLGKAVTGKWDNDNAADAGKGVYDPQKWAVVFKYTEVNIAAGATVTFKNHGSRAPVVWLVSGNVVVDGTLSLDGQDGQVPPLLAEPGPGGFRGGAGYFSGVSPGGGFGLGGGGVGYNDGFAGVLRISSGAYGGEPVHNHPFIQLSPGTKYGNPSLIPLIGGSGGGGSTIVGREGGSDPSGGAGGGALLIACATELRVNGSIHAIGGVALNAGGGSGGGLRLIASLLSGNGSISALGAPSRGLGGAGRTRIERVLNSNILTVAPDPSVIDLAEGSTALLWPPDGAPEVRVVSVGGQNTPADPRAGFGTIGADVALPLAISFPVIVETKNVEQASQVKVRGTPRSGGSYSEISATVDTIVSADPLVIRWKAELPVLAGYNAVQVRVVRP